MDPSPHTATEICFAVANAERSVSAMVRVLAAHEKARRTVAQPLMHLRQGESDLAHLLQFTSCHDSTSLP